MPGHRLSAEGVHPDNEKIAAMRDMPTPQTRSELKRFLGMITYVSKFIPHFSVHTDPVRQLLRKDVDWQWSCEHEEAFNRLKGLLQWLSQQWQRRSSTLIQLTTPDCG